MAHTLIATWIQVPRCICLCVRVECEWTYPSFMHASLYVSARMPLETFVGVWWWCVCADRGSGRLGYVSEKKAGWEDLLKCAPLCRTQLWHLCWSAASKHPISRSILSLQTLHIFHCVEQYFSMIFCLLCIQKLPQMWFVSVTSHDIISILYLPPCKCSPNPSNVITRLIIYV